ncbi:MAG: hypothetical protein IH840_00030 [Candidatus Heimdallarchaeota archaeon]|nr:hypothetical protein [Candidatus Heimdallarchaeota archaeon]
MTFTGTATLSGIQGYSVLQSINAYATAEIEILDKGFSNIATLKANALKSIIKTHSKYSNIIFRGELRSMSISQDKITYRAYDKSRKLLNQIANYNAILDSGYIRQITRTNATNAYELKDRGLYGSGIWSTDEHNTRFLHYTNTRKANMRITPNLEDVPLEDKQYSDGASDAFKIVGNDVSDSVTITTAPDEVYHDEGGNGNASVYGAIGAAQDIGLLFTCFLAIETGTTVKSIDSIDIACQFRVLSKFAASDSNNDDPFIGILDTDTSEYEGVYIRSSDAGGRFYTNRDNVAGFNGTNWISKLITKDDVSDFEADPTKYLTTVATYGTFTLYSIKIFVAGGQDAINRKLIAVRHLYVNVTLTADHVPVTGQVIISDGTTTTLVLNSNTNPLTEGLSLGDYWVVVKDLATQINDLATLWSITINDSIANSSTICLTEDFRDKTRIEVFQTICDISNSIWWYDPSADEYNIVSVGNISSTSLTITKADIVEYLTPGSWEYNIDADNIRDKVYVRGDSGTALVPVTTSNEFVHALGDEDVIVIKPNVNSSSEAAKLLLAEVAKYESARRTLTFTLDFDNPAQSYSALVIGKTLAAKLPTASDTSICNHSSGNDGELLITALQWIRNAGSGQRRLVTVTAEKRHGI